MGFLTEKTVEAGGDGDVVGSLRQVIVVARIAELESFDGEADAEWEARGVEAVGGFHLHHLAVAIAKAQKERGFDI